MPQIMGIVNATPDSFSDGGRFLDPERAVAHALRLIDEGADWVDIGGESTRPGAEPVPADDEINRVIPVIRGVLAARPGALVSVDTAKRAVAEAAIEAGAAMVNDVTALADPGMAELCAEARVKVVLMHMRGAPRTMQAHTDYPDLIGAVEEFLVARLEVAARAGVSSERIWLDPGVGFGKAALDNPRLIAATPRLKRLGFPVVIGASRKRFIGELTGVARPEDRLAGSLGAALAAARAGADALRVHDVLATRAALSVFSAVEAACPGFPIS